MRALPHRRPRNRDDGAVMAIFALVLVTLMISTAFAVDIGRLISTRRDMQAAADVVALDLARLADGRTEQEILDDPNFGAVRDRSLAANDLDLVEVTIDYGVITAGSYDDSTFVPTAAGQVPNAVQVRAKRTIDYAFAGVAGLAEGSTARTAIAAVDAVADLTIGTKTASLLSGDADALNFLLNNRLGPVCNRLESQGESCPDAPALPAYDFSAVGYQGLGTATVTYEELAAAAGVASPEQVADAEFTASDYARVTADALQAGGRPSEAAVFYEIADREGERERQQATPARTFRIRDVATINTGQDAWFQSNVNAFDLFINGVEAINGEALATTCTAAAGVDNFNPPSRTGTVFNVVDNGVTRVENRGVVVPAVPIDTAAEIPAPGFDTCTTVVEVGQSIVNGRVGATARTAQLKTVNHLSGVIDLSLAGALVPGLPGTLDGFGGAIDLPIEVNAIGARTQITDIDCDLRNDLHETDTLITPEPITMRVGGDDPVMVLRDSLNTIEIVVRIDKEVTPAAGSAQPILDQEERTTRSTTGSEPTLGLTLDENDIDIDIYRIPLGTPAEPPTVGRGLVDSRVTTVSDRIDTLLGTDLDVYERRVAALVAPRVNFLLDRIDAIAAQYLPAMGVAISDADQYLADVRCNNPIVIG